MDSNPSSTFVAKLAAVSALLAATSGAAAVTVLAENFAGGNPAAGTAYALVQAGAFTGPGQCRVIANPATDLTNGYNSDFDPTLGTAAGQMLFFDGAATPLPIWQASVSLTAGMSCDFSFWGSSGSATRVPTLTLHTDGAGVGTTLATTAAQWTQFSHTFTATSSGLRTFSIVDLNPTDFGNDGAIDDILLTTPVPEPGPIALMLAGLAALVAFRRRLPA